MKIYRIELNNITAGIVVRHGVVIYTAPVFSQFVDQKIEQFEAWVKRKGGRMVLLEKKKKDD